MDGPSYSKLSKEINDPDKREDAVNSLMSNYLVELTDEFGATFQVIRLGPFNITPGFLNPTLGNGVLMKDIRSIPLRADDIIFCSYMKTGTHWMCNILNFLLEPGSLEEAKVAPLMDITPDIEIASWPSPRVIHTHFYQELLPIETLKPGRRIILTYRNPKDTAVSMFHHFRKGDAVIGKLKISWNCFFEAWMKGIVVPYDFFFYYNTWQKTMEDHRDVKVLVVHYEDLKANGLEELKRIQDYIGLSHSDERLKQVLERCSFEKLKADVESKKVKTHLLDEEGRSILYRKGIVGDWKNQFTVAQSEQFDALIKDKFKASIFKRPM